MKNLLNFNQMNPMSKKDAEIEIERLIGSDISEYDNFNLPDRDFANDYDELIDWCSDHDESFLLHDKNNKVNINNFKMIFYNNDDEVNAFIVLNNNGDVFSYGYTGY